MDVKRVDLANWAPPRTSPKFTSGVKYQFHQGFWPDQRSGSHNHPSPPLFIIIITSGVKYQFHQGFWPDQRSGYHNHPSPPVFIIIITSGVKYYLSADFFGSLYRLHSVYVYQIVLPKGRSFAANSGTKVPVLLGISRCDSFPLLSAPHSLFSIWTYLKKSEKIPGAPTRRWGEWIWLTESSGLHRNSPQGLNISSIRVFDQIRDPEMKINLRPQ